MVKVVLMLPEVDTTLQSAFVLPLSAINIIIFTFLLIFGCKISKNPSNTETYCSNICRIAVFFVILHAKQ